MSDDAPYWRRHYGMGGRWQSSPAGRRGCMVMLLGGFGLLVVALLVVLVSKL